LRQRQVAQHQEAAQKEQGAAQVNRAGERLLLSNVTMEKEKYK